MANYIARVELHSATYDDYEILHSQMQMRGFYRRIVGGNGVTYELPTGTYVMRNTSISAQDAVNKAGEAAAVTGKSNSIIVADWTLATWRGLKVVP
jgi:hypothetical protein